MAASPLDVSKICVEIGERFVSDISAAIFSL